MPSEQRLHPASLLFAFARSIKAFALPGLLAFLGFGRSAGPGDDGRWQIWLVLLLVPSVLAAAARYWSFRLRYDDTELVIRTGILFRNERHVPYDRIQNLDAVQNVVHRLFGVIEVRVETGAGKEPEATISVVPASALPEMRRRVFAGRRAPAAAAAEPEPAPALRAATLLRLPLRELLLFGFLENRGLVLIGALYGLLWETGLLERWSARVLEDTAAYAPGMLRGAIRALAEGGTLPVAQVAVLAAGFLVFLLVVRLVSMVWAVVRLHGFHLSRAGEDLRTEFGLITRVSTTIPIRRVQTMIVREGPLHRAVSRVSVRVQTAGGGQAGQQQAAPEREWLAPIVHARALPALVREVMPGIDLAALEWHPAHPKAFRRAVRPAALFVLGVAGAIGYWDVRAGLLALPLLTAWSVVATWKGLAYLGWAETADVVAFRSGWLWRSVTLARLSKIQVVSQLETPFDRRWAMRRVRVDTAAGGTHRIDIPFLAPETAAALHGRLAAAAATTDFRW